MDKIVKKLRDERSSSVNRRLVRQRSVSLPDGGLTRNPWYTLNLYLKGLPPNSLKICKEKADQRRTEVTTEANTAILTLKSDRSSLRQRKEFQMRQREIGLSNLVEELRQVREAVNSLSEGQAEIINNQLDSLQEELSALVKVSQVYGRLKYENNISHMLESIRMCADGIVRDREEVIRELKIIGETIGEDFELETLIKNVSTNLEVEKPREPSPGTPDHVINWKVESELFNSQSPNSAGSGAHDSSIVLPPMSGFSSSEQLHSESSFSFDQDDGLTRFRINSNPGEGFLRKRREMREEKRRSNLSQSQLERIRFSTWITDSSRRLVQFILKGELTVWIIESIESITELELEKNEVLKIFRYLIASVLFLMALWYTLQSMVIFYNERWSAHYQFGK